MGPANSDTTEEHFSGRAEESSSGDGGRSFMAMLQGLGREEILELLSEGFCDHCQTLLQTRLRNSALKKLGELALSDSPSLASSQKYSESSVKFNSWEIRTPESREKGSVAKSSAASVNSKLILNNHSASAILVNNEGSGSCSLDDVESEEQKEQVRFAQVGRRKAFFHYEKIKGKTTNILQGLELHTQVFNAEEQKKIVDCVYRLQRMGQQRQLRERTYSEPRKWMRGKGRVTIQFGCCYNYAVDKNGNPPGIMRDEKVDPLPPLFKQMIKRMVRWQVLPPTCVPNSCIVNIYDEGDCIPPHIDHRDFIRPFCTVSFLTECNILFGADLKTIGPGEFAGPVSIPLPLGSVLVLNGNGADVAKHCVPGVPAKRISITFRKMDERKLPYDYLLEPELQGLKPLVHSPMRKSPVQQQRVESLVVEDTNSMSFQIEKEDFPPLGNSKYVDRKRT